MLAIPETHKILFTQGGGTTQFAATVLNLLAHRAQTSPNETTPPKMDYVVTGTWSQKAAHEATRLTSHPTKTAEVNIVANTKPSGYTTLPARADYKFSPKGEAAFVYYCENETINGVQYPELASEDGAFPFDLIPEGTPLVADFSSSFLSRPIANVDKYDVIYAGAQKNLSPSGLTIVIVRDSLLVDANHPSVPIPIPEILSYKTLADNDSLYNTPPVFPIYITALVVKLLAETGGLEGKREVNERKAKALYASLERGVEKGVIKLNVTKPARSWMNVVWLIAGGDEAEKRFLAGAEKRGLRQLKGHRSVQSPGIHCFLLAFLLSLYSVPNFLPILATGPLEVRRSV